MHPTKFARAWVVAGLLVGMFAMTGGPARAQEKKAPAPPMATPDQTGAVTIGIGLQVRFQMKTKKRIKEAFNEDDRVVRVMADALDPTTLILIGRVPGTSRLELTDTDGGKETYMIVVESDLELRRRKAIEAFKAVVKQTVPTASVEITRLSDAIPKSSDPKGDQPEDRTTHVILSGYAASETDRDTVSKLAVALGLTVDVNTITVGGGGNVPHVQLDLTLAKVDRTRARSRGANFIINGNTVSAGSLLGGLTSLSSTPTATTSTVNGGLAPLGVVPSAATTGVTGAANIIAGFAPSQIQLLLAALKTEGLAKLVSAPTVVARSGEEANLLVGGSVPVISPSSGITGPGVEYKDVGTEVRFTPVVYGNGKIHLTVSPRVRTVNNTNALVTTFGTSPSFEEQRITTSVIVEPGQTIAIGGLIQTSQQATVTKIPHLGDLPYLGVLFSYATQTEEEIELIILLTPRLVDPADCSQMPKALPGSETRKPDDFEFYLETILEAPRGPRQIWNGLEYTPAWKSGPSANIYPCVGGVGGAGCPDGKCGSPAAAGGKAIATPPTHMPVDPPTAQVDPLIAPPPSLLDPVKPERKTAELKK